MSIKCFQRLFICLKWVLWVGLMCLKYFISKNTLHLRYLFIQGSQSVLKEGGRITVVAVSCQQTADGWVFEDSSSRPSSSTVWVGGTSIPRPGVHTGCPHLPSTSSSPLRALIPASVCDVAKVQRFCCMFWGISLENQRCRVKITVGLLRKSWSGWASVQMIKVTFMQVQRSSRCSPLLCMVNK